MKDENKIPITYVDEGSIEELMMKTFVKHIDQNTVLNVIKLTDKYDLVRFIDENKNPYSCLVTRPKIVDRCEYSREAEEAMFKKYLKIRKER